MIRHILHKETHLSGSVPYLIIKESPARMHAGARNDEPYDCPLHGNTIYVSGLFYTGERGKGKWEKYC